MEAKSCRFCYGTEDEKLHDVAHDRDVIPPKALVAPCACRGSFMWIHYDCLRTWELNKFATHNQTYFRCGICNGPYVGKVALVLVHSLVNEAATHFGSDSTQARCLRDELTSVLCNVGDFAQAEKLGRKQVEAWMDTSDMANLITSVNNLSTALTMQHKITEAERWARKAVETCDKHFGPTSMPALNSLNDLGTLLNVYSSQKFEDAELIYRRALKGCEQSSASKDTVIILNTLSCENNLGSVLRRLGRYKEAEQFLRRAVEGREKCLGEHHTDTLSSVNNLASLLCDRGEFDAAEPLYERALHGYERTCGENDPATLALMANCARVYKKMRKETPAEHMLSRLAQLRERAHGMDDPKTLAALHDYGIMLRRANKLDDAHRVLCRVLRHRELVCGYEHADTVRVVNDIGLVLMDQGKHIEAEPYYHRARDQRKKMCAASHESALHAASEYSVGPDEGSETVHPRMHWLGDVHVQGGGEHRAHREDANIVRHQDVTPTHPTATKQSSGACCRVQ